MQELIALLEVLVLNPGVVDDGRPSFSFLLERKIQTIKTLSLPPLLSMLEKLIMQGPLGIISSFRRIFRAQFFTFSGKAANEFSQHASPGI